MPKPWRTGPARPKMWFGGQSMHPALLRPARVATGTASIRSAQPSAEDLSALRAGLAAAGRDPDEFEMVGGTRAVFSGADDTADLDQAMDDFERADRSRVHHVLREAVPAHR